MKKRIQKYGSAIVIRFNIDEKRNYNIKEGQSYDIEMHLLKKGKRAGPKIT